MTMSSIVDIINLYEEDKRYEEFADCFFFFWPRKVVYAELCEFKRIMSYATLSQIASPHTIKNRIDYKSKYSILGNLIKEDVNFEIKIDSEHDGINKKISLRVKRLSKTFGEIIYEILNAVDKEEKLFFSSFENGPIVSSLNLGDNKTNCDCKVISYRTNPIFKTKDFITFVNLIFLLGEESEEKSLEGDEPFVVVDVLIHSFRGLFKCFKCNKVFKKWE